MINKKDLKIGLLTSDGREVLEIKCGTVIYKMKGYVYHMALAPFCKEFEVADPDTTKKELSDG